MKRSRGGFKKPETKQPSIEQVNIPLFPMAQKIIAKTRGLDLVSVVPMGTSDNIVKEVKKENRSRKIESIITGSEYKEMKVEEHEDWNGPMSELFYIDYVYKTK